MENFAYSLSVILPLFSLIIIGYYLRHINVFTDEYVARSNSICYTIFLPCLIFYSIYSNSSIINEEIKTMKFVFISSAILITLVFIITPFVVKDKTKIGAIMQGLFRGNALIFGMPLVINLYGTEGIGPMSMIIAVVMPFYNISTVIILSTFDLTKKMDSGLLIRVLKDLVKNPLIIAAIASIVISLIHCSVPQFVLSTVKSISDIATPLALLSLGGSFEFGKLLENRNYLLIVCVFKMIIMPIIMISVAIRVGFRSAQLVGIMVLYSSPIAVSSYVMTREANGDYELAGQLVVMSTLFSVVTIFVAIYFLRFVKYI